MADKFDEKASAMLSAWVTRADESVALVTAFAAALREADRAAREDCADIADAHASCEGIAEKVAAAIRATIKQEGK